MTLSSEDLAELTERAITAATEAGRMVAGSGPQHVEHKADGASLASQVVTEIDRQSEVIILNALTPTLDRFGLGLLTEERDDDGSRLTADYFWCIDPLDGTLSFVEGTPGYSVSIALVANDGTPCIGVVYDPVYGTLLHATRGSGAFRNGEPFSAEHAGGEVLSMFTDRSFLTSDDFDATMYAMEEIARDLNLSSVQLEATRGGVLNACAALANTPGCYFKFPAPAGGGSLWDFAATACLFHEAGAIATDIHGEPLDLNRADSTEMAHRGVLFATDEALATHIRQLASTG